jgi:hypothetical protein
METLKNFFFAIAILIIFIFIFSQAKIFPQSNVITKPGQVIKLIWDASTEPDVWQYAIFYCQGADTSLFPFNTGTDPDSLWNGNEPVSDWSLGTIYDLKFFVEPKKMQGTTYLRLGVSGINQAGELGIIQCIPKVITIKRPAGITGVKTQ